MSAIFNTKPLRMQPGPANYWSYPGALGQLEQLYSAAQLEHAICITGSRAYQAAQAYLPDSIRTGTRQIACAGHCTHAKVNALVNHHGAAATLVIGIGGGSVLDTAKALAAQLGIPFVAIPTIAATCAAFTPLVVWYAEDGHALGYEIFTRAAEAVLVDPRILLQAPPAYLRAGLADTLAKWYEADILCAQESALPYTAMLGLSIAQNLRDTLLTKGNAAFAAVAQGCLSADFCAVVDAIIAGGGLVGGLGERYTRIAAAHAVHNGLSALPESAQHLHGLKVAYGILVQSALQGKPDELRTLAAQFRSLGLPTNLADLGIDPRHDGHIAALVAATLAPHESIHLLPFPVSPATLQKAIMQVECMNGG
jgi:hydroxycarboxylate dehydrogenase A